MDPSPSRFRGCQNSFEVNRGPARGLFASARDQPVRFELGLQKDDLIVHSLKLPLHSGVVGASDGRCGERGAHAGLTGANNLVATAVQAACHTKISASRYISLDLQRACSNSKVRRLQTKLSFRLIRVCVKIENDEWAATSIPYCDHVLLQTKIRKISTPIRRWPNKPKIASRNAIICPAGDVDKRVRVRRRRRANQAAHLLSSAPGQLPFLVGGHRVIPRGPTSQMLELRETHACTSTSLSPWTHQRSSTP